MIFKYRAVAKPGPGRIGEGRSTHQERVG